MTLKERAEKYIREEEIRLSGNHYSYMHEYKSEAIARRAFEAGFREAIRLAAAKCATSSAGDCCHETAERNAEAIRARSGFWSIT